MKRKVNIDRTEISSEEITRQMDFQAVLKGYQSSVKPFYRQPWVISSAVAAVLIAVTAFWIWPTLENQQDERLLASIGSGAFVSPPIAGIDVPFEEYEINANEASVIQHSTGSIIRIPANAFIDKEGNLVDGTVAIKYREFHDQIDILFSGIPMQYDSAGSSFQLESAGMMEIVGFKDNEPVFVKEDKALKVAMTSYKKGEDYNLYYLDTIQKNWVNIGKDSIVEQVPSLLYADTTISYDESEIMSNDQTRIAEETNSEQIRAEINELLKREPLKPKKRDESKYHFEVDILPEEFPELAGYNGAEFEVIEEKSDFDPSYYNIEWNSLDLERSDKGKGEYKMTIAKGKRKHIMYVYPVFEGKNYDEALKEFDKQYANYQVELAAKKQREAELKKEYDAMMAKLREEIRLRDSVTAERKRIAREEAIAMKEGEVAFEQQNVLRNFQVNGFGVYNCDRPLRQSMPRFAAKFILDNNEEVRQPVFLIDKNLNTVVKYYPANFGEFKMSLESSNVMVSFLDDQSIAVFEQKFYIDPKKDGPTIFHMQTLDNSFKTVKDFKTFINI